MTTPGATMAPRVPIDPRIRQRRVEVMRREGRRRLRVLVVTAVITGVTGVGWLVTRSPLLDIDRVEVSGAAGTEADDVLAAAGIHRHRPMVDLHADTAAVRAERLAWVSEVIVRRRWPGTVTVEVRRRVPVAVVGSNRGHLALVDPTGLVVAESDQPPAGTVRVEGVPPAGPPGSRLPAFSALAIRVADAMPRRLAPRVETVVIAGGEVELRLRPVGALPGARVRMGGADRVEEKLMSVEAVLDGVDVRTMAGLDVRLPDNPVVTRHPAPGK